MAAETDPLALSPAAAEQLSPKELEAALKAWVKAGKVELPAALAASPDKAVARLGKKALYQLKSGGVAVPEAAPAPAATGEKPTAAPAVSDDVAAGILSHVLGTGERALFFARPQRGGGLELYQCILHDELGIQQLDRAEANRSAFRKRLKEVRAKKEPVLIVDLDRVRAELGRALHLNAESKTPLPKDADSALRRLEVRELPGAVEFPLPEAGDPALAARGAELFEQDEIAQWLPGDGALKILSQRIEEVNASPLELSAAQKQQQIDAKVQATAREFFTERARALYAARLWSMAEIFEATGRAEPAAIARAASRTLASGAWPSAFASRFFGRLIELAKPAGGEREGGRGPEPAAAPPGRIIVP